MSNPVKVILPTDKAEIRRIEAILEQLEKNYGEGCWPCPKGVKWVYKGKKYPSLRYKINGITKTTRASRLLYSMFIGEIPDGMLIRHTCNNKSCLNPHHFLPGTPADNARDKSIAEKGLGLAAGERNGNAKLTRNEVATEIIPRLTMGNSNSDIAKDLGVTPATINSIRLGKTWKNVAKECGWTPQAPKYKRRSPTRKSSNKTKKVSYNSKAPFTEDFLAKFKKLIIERDEPGDYVSTPCHEFVGRQYDGYGSIRWLSKNKLAHHIAFRATTGRWPKRNWDIAHLCQNKLCVNPDHLKEMTKKEHRAYDAACGIFTDEHLGQKNNTKLGDSDIRSIKELLVAKPYLKDKQIKEFLSLDVTCACIADVRRGRTGEHVQVIGFSPIAKNGAAARGAEAGMSKIKSDTDAKEIRRRFSEGEAAHSIAEDYGVNERTIRDIGTGRTWKHLEGGTISKRAARRALVKSLEPTIIARLRNGDSHQGIANDLKIGRTSVTKIAKRYCIGLRQ